MERMCLTKVNLLSSITPRMLKDLHEFKEVLSIIRSGWGGNIITDLLAIMLWVLLRLSHIPHELNHVLILLRSLLRDSVTSDLIFGYGKLAKRVASSVYDTIIFSSLNHISWVYNMKNKGPRTLPCGTPEKTLLHSLDWPSTTTV